MKMPSTTTTTTTSTPALRLTPLGGVGHFGRNCLLVEQFGEGGVAGEALLVDCGVRFPGPELPGFDAALPDLERLAGVGDRLKAVVVTHGHEDHIGALPFLLRERPGLPVYCTGFTAHFIARRCRRFDVDVDPIVLPFGEVRAVAGCGVSFAAVSHSIPGAASLVLRTPVGVVVHSGDFRVDEDPLLGPPTDLDSLAAAAGEDGVRCLLADSTGALSDDRRDVGAAPARRSPERDVGVALDRCFVGDDGAPFGGLVVVGLFASHLQRLALLAETCRRHRRKLLLLGTGLAEVYAMTLAHRDDSFLHGETGGAFFADVVVDEAGAKNLPRDRLCIAATGTQGEAQAALARLARGDAGLPFAVGAGDRVVFSARVIPGNELKVQAVVDALVDRGCDVVVGRSAPHVSGHGGLRDLQDLIGATRPQSFVALHGTPMHLVAHGRLARALGVDADRVVGLRDGHSLVLTRDGVRHVESVPASEPAAVDGEVCDFPRGIARSRRRLHEGGVLVLEVKNHIDDDGHETLAIHGVTARGVFPPVDEAMTRTLTSILRERHRQGLPLDGDDAEKHFARPWKKRWRPAPEIVILRR
jgi:ribonuclease J